MKRKEKITDLKDRFAQALALPIETIQRIKRNKYCEIYLGRLSERVGGYKKCILKRYYGHDYTMAAQEARALDYYSHLVEGRDDWMPSRCLAFSDEANMLAIQFMPGVPFSRFVYRVRKGGGERIAPVLRICRGLGEMLRKFHDDTANSFAEPSDVLFDYMRYVSSRLEDRNPYRFAGYYKNAEKLIEDYVHCGVPTTFCHGDFVMRNMHVDVDQVSGQHRVGLIDFGNSLDHSHVLGDLFGFYFSAIHVYLSQQCRRHLVSNVVHGLVGRDHLLRFPEAAVRFYFEFHRRRWMLLKFRSRNFLQRYRAKQHASTSMPDLDLFHPSAQKIPAAKDDWQI